MLSTYVVFCHPLSKVQINFNRIIKRVLQKINAEEILTLEI